jgi:hypothetical protein
MGKEFGVNLPEIRWSSDFEASNEDDSSLRQPIPNLIPETMGEGTGRLWKVGRRKSPRTG